MILIKFPLLKIFTAFRINCFNGIAKKIFLFHSCKIFLIQFQNQIKLITFSIPYFNEIKMIIFLMMLHINHFNGI